jgi:hypothetical protein
MIICVKGKLEIIRRINVEYVGNSGKLCKWA